MRKIVSYLLSVILIVALAGCGGNNKQGDSSNPQPGTTTGTTTPAPAAGGTSGTVDAQAVFKQNCIACHGTDLAGKLGPNTNLQKVGARMNRDQIVNQITNGGNGMVPFKGKLKQEEINALADWLSAKK